MKVRRNWLGESRKIETERRVKALETHVQDLEKRLGDIMYAHLTEFHPGQDAVVPLFRSEDLPNARDNREF